MPTPLWATRGISCTPRGRRPRPDGSTRPAARPRPRRPSRGPRSPRPHPRPSPPTERRGDGDMPTCTPRSPLIGSLCSGYGGLDLEVQAVLGGSLAWHAEINRDAARILARHWPGVPNLGDITAINSALIPRVCVLTAGFPCQRRLRRRPPSRTQRPHPLRPVAARRPCGRSPPPLPGRDRECPRTPHLTRRHPWRRGTLRVVSGRHHNPASSARTWCRTRLPGRTPVRRTVDRASCLRRRGPSPSRAGLPRRLARRRPCSRPRPATSARTVVRSIRRRGRAAATVRTWPTRWSGCCSRRRRRPTRSRARRISGTATAT